MNDFLEDLLNPQDPLQWAFLIFIGLMAFSAAVLITLTLLNVVFDKLFSWTGKFFFLRADESVNDLVGYFGKIIKWPLRISGYFILGVILLYLLHGLSGGLLEILGV